MTATEFIDYYEVLEISPNANIDTIDRVFRFLAQRYHPDHAVTGDHNKFSDLVKAHETLRDPEKRAKYDIAHSKYSEQRWRLSEEAGDKGGFELDTIVQDRLLSILYVKRRRDMRNPGIGNLALERLSGCPPEHIEFHLWYLKEKGWITRMEDGLLSITVSGIDQANMSRSSTATSKLLTDQHTKMADA